MIGRPRLDIGSVAKVLSSVGDQSLLKVLSPYILGHWRLFLLRGVEYGMLVSLPGLWHGLLFTPPLQGVTGPYRGLSLSLSLCVCVCVCVCVHAGADEVQ